jgi:hypothetical protein
LTSLNLRANEIQSKGLKILAEALRFNRVNVFQYISLSYLYLHFFIKALKELSLESNKIGELEAKHLADILQNNRVNFSFCETRLKRSLTAFSFRH